MDLSDLRAQLAAAAPGVVGARIKAARVRAGLTQGEVAQGRLSVSFLSRIESGQRRPDGDLLLTLAERLAIDPETLLDPATDAGPAVAAPFPCPALDFAEIALEMGDPQTALTHLIELDLTALPAPVRARADTARAKALEGSGDLNGAISVLERLLAQTEAEPERIALAIMLSRCHRELGELDDATRVGESVLGRAADAGLEASEAVVQLRVTLAAAYYEKGELDHALRLCRESLEVAESVGTPAARAYALWETSVVVMGAGDPDGAVPLARQALEILHTRADQSLVSRLRLHVGLLELKMEAPDVTRARQTLLHAADEMRLNHSTSTERLEIEVGLARCDLLDGDPEAAWSQALHLLPLAREVSSLNEADVLTLLGQAGAARGDVGPAREYLLMAVHRLHAVGSSREAAQRWMELGELLEQVGELAAAVTAYRAAAASTGLRPLARPVPRSAPQRADASTR